MFAVGCWGMLTFEMFTTAGPKPMHKAEQGIKFSYLAIPLWACSISWTKMGVCFMLLRIRSSLAWNGFLYTIIVSHVLFQIAVLLFNLLQCRPLEAAWLGVLPGSRCLSPHAMSVMVTTTSGWNIATDILVSLAPIRFLATLHRPVQERISVGILMGLGLIASAVALRKLILVQEWGKDIADMWNQGVAIGTLVMAEVLLASFAASAICFKAAHRRMFIHLGLTVDDSQASSSYGKGLGGASGKSNDTGASKSTSTAATTVDDESRLEARELVSSHAKESSHLGLTKSVTTTSSSVDEP